MKLLISLLLLSSVAHGACMTSGGCPRETVDGITCAIVKTGLDPQNNVTCAKYCYSTPLAYQCKVERGRLQGECVIEKQKNPYFDPNHPEACRRAIEI